MATRTVVGTYKRIDDTPCQGTIEFTPTSNIIKRGSVIYVASTVVGYLDSAGSFSVNLMVSDDPLLEPSWQWCVEEKVEGGKIWFMEVPTGATPIDISDVIPSTPSMLLQSFEFALLELQRRVEALESE